GPAALNGWHDPVHRRDASDREHEHCKRTDGRPGARIYQVVVVVNVSVRSGHRMVQVQNWGGGLNEPVWSAKRRVVTGGWVSGRRASTGRGAAIGACGATAS